MDGGNLHGQLAPAVAAQVAIDFLKERPAFLVGSKAVLKGPQGSGAVHRGGLDVPVVVGEHEALSLAFEVQPLLGEPLV
jgi:hypothetical protein